MDDHGQVGVSHGHSLAFLALISFVLSFFAARVFTTFQPTTVVVTGGIHFHHFWYGLLMVVVAGWLGIVSNSPRMDRIYALLFGLGGGLIGDEVGLLLTLGDYRSELTYVFFVGAVCFAALGLLVFRYRERLEQDLMIGRGERMVHVGIYVTGLSALAFAFGYSLLGAFVATVGGALFVVGYWLHRSSRASPS